MSELLCVTNRRLCDGDFPERIAAIADCRPAGIILREKDLPEEEYEALARQVLAVCKARNVRCILHTFVPAALRLGADAIHLPLPVLRRLTAEEKARFSVLGASCHSAEDAREARELGCTYITAGHVFATDCKKGLPPRGLDFLRRVCRAVDIPVYAIGGVSAGNFADVLAAGAAGGCVMSGPMACGDVREYFQEFQKAGEPHGI